MRPSPLLATAAALSLLGAISGPALAATDAKKAAPAAGAASSGVTLLELAVQGRTVSAGTLELLSETLTGANVAKVVVTPLEADGTAYGAQTVTPASSPASVPAVSSDAVLPGLDGIASVASPGFTVSASETGGATSKAEASSLGGVSLLGLPLDLNGTLDVGSTVNDKGALSGKTLEVTDLALPSIADLLAALGLDLSLLPVEVLNELVAELDLVTTTVEDLNAALDQAQAALQAQIDAATAQVDSAAEDLAGKEGQLAPLNEALFESNEAVDAAQDVLAGATQQVAAADQQLQTALGGLTLDAYRALPPLLQAPLQPAVDAALAAQADATAAVTAATSALAQAESLADAAQAAVDALEAAIAIAQDVLDAAQQLLTDLLSTLLEEVQALVGALVAVLDGTPLVSIDSLTVTTSATATSAAAGGQAAEVVGGEVVGLRVLGTDVLDDVLGNTRLVLDPTTLTSQLAPVTELIDTLTGTLSEVLSTVPGLPELKVPAPEVGLLTKTTETSIVDGFGTAATGVRALSVSIPAITVPDLSVLPELPGLPASQLVPSAAIAPAATTSSPVTLSVGALTDRVQFRPAVVAPPAAAPGKAAPGTAAPAPGTGTATPTAASRQLPRTGASTLLAGLAVVLMGGALVARRRAAAGDLAEDTAL